MFTIDPTSARFSREFRAFRNNQGNRYTDEIGRLKEIIRRRGMGQMPFAGSPSVVLNVRPGTLTDMITGDEFQDAPFLGAMSRRFL